MSPHPHWRDLILTGDLMSTDQAAEYLSVAKVTIRVWDSRGWLKRLNQGDTPPLYLRTALDRCNESREDNHKYKPRRTRKL